MHAYTEWKHIHRHTQTCACAHTHAHTLIMWLTVKLRSQSSAKVRIDLHRQMESPIRVCACVYVFMYCIQPLSPSLIETHTHSPVALLCATSLRYHSDDVLAVHHHDGVTAQWKVKGHMWHGVQCVCVYQCEDCPEGKVLQCAVLQKAVWSHLAVRDPLLFGFGESDALNWVEYTGRQQYDSMNAIFCTILP